jgi:phosphatidylglycerophosphate synthase
MGESRGNSRLFRHSAFFLDTISDKIFVAGALLPMVERGLLPGWVALIIIIREFAVSGLRSYAAAEGEVIAARQWGKQKLVFTVCRADLVSWWTPHCARFPDRRRRC